VFDLCIEPVTVERVIAVGRVADFGEPGRVEVRPTERTVIETAFIVSVAKPALFVMGCDQRIIQPLPVRPMAGPGIMAGMLHHAGANRIELDVLRLLPR
jgi:hypothetical protein